MFCRLALSVLCFSMSAFCDLSGIFVSVGLDKMDKKREQRRKDKEKLTNEEILEGGEMEREDYLSYQVRAKENIEGEKEEKEKKEKV